MTKWIFFDIGSTLVDETEAYDHRAREMIAGTYISFEDFASKRIELAKQGLDGNSAAIEFFALKKTPWHSEDEVPFPDASDTLRYLKDRGYRLGIIANQPMGTEQRLEKWGLRGYFSVIAASAELGAAKPDPAIFREACRLAGCRPEEAVMIGDRLDNDILPAKALGMGTVWIRKGTSAYQTSEVSDHTINALADLKALFRGSEVEAMSLISGCQEGKGAPRLVEVKCPQCGEIVEVFVKMGGAIGQTGTLVSSETCDCGYVLKVGTYEKDYDL